MPEVCLSRGLLLDEDEFRIDGAVFDHGIPRLAFVFEEKLRVNVWSEGLRRLGLPTGPWLREAKRAVRRGAPDDSHISIRGDLSLPLGVLTHLLRAPCKGAISQWGIDPPGNFRSSR
jgi:ribonuclease Z